MSFSLLLPCVVQVLYQAVNYQMEPVITESRAPADETNPPEVCVTLHSAASAGPFVGVFCVFSHCFIFNEL